MQFRAALIAAVLAGTAGCPFPFPFFQQRGPPPPPTDPEAICTSTRQAIAIRPSNGIDFRVDGGDACVPGSTHCTTGCSVELGDVAVGETALVHVKIEAATGSDGFVDIFGVNIDSVSADWYVEGQPPTVVQPGGNDVVTLALRASEVGACDAKLLIGSDATNQQPGDLAITIHANCVAGAAPGCATTGACCCANGATSGDATCDASGHVGCASGFVSFDDACNAAPCVP